MKQRASKSRRLLLLLLTVSIALMPESALAKSDGKTLQKQYTFKTKKLSFDYEPKMPLVESGREYIPTEIRYEVVKEQKAIARDYQFANLKEKKVPKTKQFQIEGKTVTLKQAGAPDWEAVPVRITYSQAGRKEPQKKVVPRQEITVKTERIPIRETVRYQGIQTSEKIPKRKIITGGYPAALVKIREKTEVMAHPFFVQGRFQGARGSTYYLGKQKVPVTEQSPLTQAGKELILKHFGLDESYRITSGAWLTGYRFENGKIVRYARFFGTHKVESRTFLATYEAVKTVRREVVTETKQAQAEEREALQQNAQSKKSKPRVQTEYRYNAKVRYTNGLEKKDDHYLVRAEVTYQEVEKVSWIKILTYAGAGILTGSMLVMLILYLLSKRRREIEK